jgi:spermidine synthase
MFSIEPFFYSTSEIIDSRTTVQNVRMTHLKHADFGHISVMNNEVQSATVDERIYHETLVHPAMTAARRGSPEKVLIVGGGEGCTAREVLRWNSVKHVDMIDWDPDVIAYFLRKDVCCHWNTETVWTDARLHIQFGDIWKILGSVDGMLRRNMYDCIVIDLFDPDANDEQGINRWQELIQGLVSWLAPEGAIVFYAGMRVVSCKNKMTSYDRTTYILKSVRELWRNADTSIIPIFNTVIPYKTWIPSFGGEAAFVVASNHVVNSDLFPIKSHLHKAGVWESYCVWNDLGQTGLAT